MIWPSTPSQTVGPYFAIGLPWPAGPHAVATGTAGAITIRGTVYDGAGSAIPDFLLETWQADPDGRFADMWGYGGPSQLDGFRGFSRCGFEDGDGSFEIVTVKPGPVTLHGGAIAAPHIDVSLFARGMLHRVVTRWYFADEEEAFGLQYCHGIGLSVWEQPLMSRYHSFEHPVELEEGMVFAIETYWPSSDANSAARIEEEIHVTADGARLLTRFPAQELLVTGTRYWNGHAFAAGANAISPPRKPESMLDEPPSAS